MLGNFIEGLSNFGEATALGFGNYLGDKVSHISAGEVYYGGLEAINERKEELKSAIKSRADILTSIVVSNGLANLSKAGNFTLEVDISDIVGGSGSLVTTTGHTVAVVGEAVGVLNVPATSGVVATGGIINAVSGGSSKGAGVESAETKGTNKSISKDNRENEKKMEEVRAKGKQGELEAGIDPEVKKTKIESITETAKRRFPDEIDEVEGYLREIKNVKKQSYTNQIKDFNLYSQEKGLNFYLEVRPNTKLTRPLLEEVEKGNIIIKYIGEGVK